MQIANYFKGKKLVQLVLLLLLIAFLISKAVFLKSNDINVYLFAAESYLNGANIYTNNPFNFYLYSPFFALILSPLIFLPNVVAVFLWLALNFFCLWRIFVITRDFAMKHMPLDKKHYRWWLAGVIVLSIGFVNHNVNLGQITILILWLTIEAITQVNKGNNYKAAALLAIGINIKIIPFIVIGYWFLQGKFKAIAATLLLLGLTFVIPALYSGWERNAELHSTWAETINPSREKYAFENNDGCVSLNAILPAYFYTFPEKDVSEWNGFERKIYSLDYNTLKNILQFLRIFFLLSVAVIVFYKAAHRRNNFLYQWWEISYVLLVSLIIFPHQMKYTMLYFVPIAAYVLYYFLRIHQSNVSVSKAHKTIGITAVVLIVILSIMGRDIIGRTAVDFLDFYGFMGLSNLIFIPILYYCTPYRFNKLTLGKTN